MTFNNLSENKNIPFLDNKANRLNSLINDIEDKFRLFSKHYIDIEEHIRLIPAMTEKKYLRSKNEM